MPSENILIIFIKYPQAGHVKTRLAKTIGKKKATALYKDLAEGIVRSLQSNKFKTIIFYSPQSKGEQFKEWLGDNLCYCPQKGRNLGQRLSNAFKEVFKRKAKKAIVIGADSPAVNKKIVNKAFKELENYSCVIGPACDGGYYLLGLKQQRQELFKGIPWSSKGVCVMTTNIAKKLGLKVYKLEELSDIDIEEDLKKMEPRFNKRLFYK